MFLVQKCLLTSHFVRAFSSKKSNFYSILGVKASATQAEIKTAYFELSKIHHPDTNQGSKDSAETFWQVNEAYEVLGNVSSRRLYDRGLVVGGSGTVLRDDEKDVTPVERFYRQREKRQQVPTPLDRETVYDYDAWTRAHYSKTKDRHFAAKKRYEASVHRFQDFRQASQMNRAIFGVFLSLLVILGLSELIFDEQYDKNTVNTVNKSKDA